MELADVSREQATAALATIEESRSVVLAERSKRAGRRYRSLALGVFTPLVMYGSKDLVRSRAKRWALIAGWQGAAVALGIATSRRAPGISRLPTFRPESPQRQAMTTMTAIAGLAVAERLVVLLLRRSRLRRPNVAAGFVVAALRTGFRGFLLERLVYAGQGGDELAASAGQLHDALLPPDTLRVAALLGGGEVMPLDYVRDTFGIDRLELAERLQPLFDDKLATSITARDSVNVCLTPDGRDAFARHVRALRDVCADVSTGDTPR